VSQAGEEVYLPAPGQEVAPYENAGDELEWADLRSVVSWVRNHRVLVLAIVVIAAQLAWKAQFLSHLYFRQDDFHDLDLAVDRPLSWSYLTYIGSGHLIVGLRVVAWVLVRVSGTYNWGLASAVNLAFVAAAGLAALRLLRQLFGERPFILIPLGVYLLSPLTMPDLGIWSSALESVPLQLAIFMALSAHVHYVRTDRTAHLAAAGFWVAFGLAFFEKGLVLPLLLFAVTAAFLTDSRSLLAGSLRTLLAYWKAWLLYAGLMVGYVILLAISLRTSAAHPHAPGSLNGVRTFAWGLLKDSFTPAAVGGPFQWLPVADRSYSFAAPPTAQLWLAGAVVIAVIVVSIGLRRTAWRAWAILAGWIALADMLPVVIGRLNAFSPTVLGLETRYLADAIPVLAVCLGLAFAPVTGIRPQATGAGRHLGGQGAPGQQLRTAAAALAGLFVFGSIWSAQAYESVTSGSTAAAYIGNAARAVQLAPAGTPVFNRAVPGDIVEGLFGSYALQSKVLGDVAPGKLRWITRPAGTLDGLTIFSNDGRLHPAQVTGAPSLPRPAGDACWPARHGRIVIRFWRFSPAYTGIMRIGYLASTPGLIDVQFGGITRSLAVERGLHTAYLSVTGIVNHVIVRPGATSGVCVGDVQAGNLGPAAQGRVLPPPASGG
jgi:hypothetical protein